MTAPSLLLTVHDLRIGYRETSILPPLSFELHRGQVSSIIGHNGSGKSTLLRTLLGLTLKVGGNVHFFPEARIGYVPQREAMDPIYPVRVKEVVETGRYGIRGVGKRLQPDDKRKVHEAMEATGILPLAKRLFRTLSGGEQQRALLARAYSAEPSILILDEPTASMDEKGSKHTMQMTLDLAKKSGAAILMVNHFLDLVADCSDQVVLLDRENQIVRVGPPAELLRGRGKNALG